MPTPSRILILDSHPDDDSFCRGLGESYARGASESGAEVRRLVLGHLSFDPILRYGYRKRMELEPDLRRAQQDILWAEHLVIVHPVWWGAYPALLKGFLDRVFLPGFSFRHRENSVWWDKLLTGRSGRIIYTLDQPGWYYRFVNGRPSVMSLKRMVLEFCGVCPVKVTCIGPIRRSSDPFRAKWITRIEKLGRKRG